MKFKRSLFGYNPESVKEIMDALDVQYKNEIEDLETRLSQLTDENSSIRNKLKTSEEEISQVKNLEEELRKVLLPAYLKSTEKIYKAKKKAADMEEKKSELYSINKKKNLELDGSLEKLIEKMRFIVEE